MKSDLFSPKSNISIKKLLNIYFVIFEKKIDSGLTNVDIKNC